MRCLELDKEIRNDIRSPVADVGAQLITGDMRWVTQLFSMETMVMLYSFAAILGVHIIKLGAADSDASMEMSNHVKIAVISVLAIIIVATWTVRDLRIVEAVVTVEAVVIVEPVMDVETVAAVT